MPSTNHSRDRHALLSSRLKDAIRRRRVTVREMKVGKAVDLQITSESECPICLEALRSKNIAVTPCGHKFCFTCIVENFKTSKSCPMCRGPLCPEIPRPRLDDSDVGEMVYLNGGELVRDVVCFARQMDRYEATLEDDEESDDSAGFVEQPDDDNELAGIAELFDSEDMPSHGDVFSRLGPLPAESDDEESDDEESDDEDADSDTDSSSSIIGYEELADELLDRCGGRLSDREKSIVTLCLKHLGDSSFSVRDWYDRNK